MQVRHKTQIMMVLKICLLLLTSLKLSAAVNCDLNMANEYPKTCNQLNKNYKTIYIDCKTCITSEQETVNQHIKYFNKYNEDLASIRKGVNLKIKESFANICNNKSKKCKKCLEADLQKISASEILVNCNKVKTYDHSIMENFLDINQEVPDLVNHTARACFCTYAVPTFNGLFEEYFESLEEVKKCDHLSVYKKLNKNKIDLCIS